MSQLNIEQLKAKVAELTQANLAKIKEQAEIAKLQAIIKLESNEDLLNAKAKLMMSSENSEKLQTLIKECSEIISSMPVHNAKTRTNRVWAGSHRYGYGAQVDNLYELATGILYACAEHKELLLAHTNLNSELLGQLVEAFGNPAYYSRNNNVLVEAKPADVDAVKSCISIMQSQLEVVIDTSKITANNIELEYVKAETKAMQDLDSASEAIAEADFEA